ncbi:hypothetical protein [Herbaspirillum frisingense]|uniref:hypothetical protein n=1 Tax=Herbaspirillum frisingense TaxID=92645 RepID=UPI0039AF1856
MESEEQRRVVEHCVATVMQLAIDAETALIQRLIDDALRAGDGCADNENRTSAMLGASLRAKANLLAVAEPEIAEMLMRAHQATQILPAHLNR